MKELDSYGKELNYLRFTDGLNLMKSGVEQLGGALQRYVAKIMMRQVYVKVKPSVLYANSKLAGRWYGFKRSYGFTVSQRSQPSIGYPCLTYIYESIGHWATACQSTLLKQA